MISIKNYLFIHLIHIRMDLSLNNNIILQQYIIAMHRFIYRKVISNNENINDYYG